MDPAARTRQVTCQLVRGKDDDLIAWLETYPKGSLNQIVKAALRHAMETIGEIPFSLQNGHSDPALNERIAELEAMVSHLSKRVEGLWSPFDYFPESQVESMPALSDEEQEERAARLKKAKW